MTYKELYWGISVTLFSLYYTIKTNQLSMKKFLSFLFVLCLGMNVMAENSVVNGDFSDGTTGWTIACQNAADTNVYAITTSEDGLQVA